MRHLSITLVAFAALCGCREGVATPQPTGAPVAEGSAAAPAFTRDGAPAGEVPALAAAAPADEATDPGPGDEAAAADQEPTADEEGAGAPDPAGGDEAEEGREGDAEAAAGAEAEPLPDVEVKNVGMHIGGGKNTSAEKRPIREAVAPHFDDLRRCYGKADNPANDATFGVDLRIPGEGGAPKVQKPRSGLKGDGVTDCMVSVFEAIEFPRQPHGQPRMVSYSVRFHRK